MAQKSVHPGDDGPVGLIKVFALILIDWFVVTTKECADVDFKSLSMRQAWIEHESLILAQNERWRQA